jgi:hypothetical protein
MTTEENWGANKEAVIDGGFDKQDSRHFLTSLLE